MNPTKIPNSLLKLLKCSICRRILSQSPIHLDENGEHFCGNCVSEKKYIRCKALEAFASLYLFPCNHLSEGCEEYLRFDEVEEHEEQCLHRTLNCPVTLYSKCDWVGTILRIFEHYSQKHKHLCLKEPFFKIHVYLNYEFCTIINFVNVRILLRCKIQRTKCYFNALCLAKSGADVKYRIKISSQSRSLELEEQIPLKPNEFHKLKLNVLEVDMESLLALLNKPQVVDCTVSLDQEARSIDFSIDDSLICSNCNFGMVPPIYRCPLSHVVCVDCKGYKSTCKICKNNDLEFARAFDLEELSQESHFICRWKSCEQIFTCDEIRLHEQDCTYRLYCCPECKIYLGDYQGICKHLKYAHAKISFHIIDDGDSLSFALKNATMNFVIVGREIFKVNIITDALSGWAVYIWYYGPPGLESRWKYEVLDHLTTTYALKCNNQCKVVQSKKNLMFSQHYLSVKFYKLKQSNWIPFDKYAF